MHNDIINGYVRCSGINQNGERCKNPSIKYVAHLEDQDIIQALSEEHFCKKHKNQHLLLRKAIQAVHNKL